ncbi:MAG: enoyl-CoA hydratase/isomerase family protein [Chloroflexi bacterium]|nr:enoyl-CoA hydratase/isomerase family protein [Chloroflexota bacterium]
MSYETILVERKDKIGIIKLNRPQQRNAISVQLITDVVAALRDFDVDPQINVVVIMSNLPTVFCAGKDLAESSSNLAADIIRQREISNSPVELWFTLRNMKKIVIAAVNGYALAGGTGFAASCDIVIAAEDAVFGLTEVNIGLFPMTIAPAMVRNMSSLKKCFELCATGERFGAREAEKLGMVNKVVPSDKLIEETMEFAHKIAEQSPTALQVGKQFFYNMLDMDYAQATKYAAEMLSILAVSDDGKEGMRAFLEKRKPVWKQAPQGKGKQ